MVVYCYQYDWMVETSVFFDSIFIIHYFSSAVIVNLPVPHLTRSSDQDNSQAWVFSGAGPSFGSLFFSSSPSPWDSWQPSSMCSSLRSERAVTASNLLWTSCTKESCCPTTLPLIWCPAGRVATFSVQESLYLWDSVVA